MARRDRPGARATAGTVRVMFEPSRIAGEALARAYIVAVPTVRRQVPASGPPDPAARTHMVADQQRGGTGR